MATTTNKRNLRIGVGLVGSLIGLAAAVYVASYSALSVNGRYEATVRGLDHVKHRGWIPRGFETSGEWNRGVVYPFYPLWRLDRMYWHTERKVASGLYPVNSDDYYMFRSPPVKQASTPKRN